MDNTLFYNSFHFRMLSAKKYRHTDNSRGIDCHFLARMRHGSARFVTEAGEVMEVGVGDIFYLPLGLRYHSYWTPDAHGAQWDSLAFLYFPDKSGKRYAMQKLTSTETAHAHLDAIAADPHVTPSSVAHLYAVLGEAMGELRMIDPDPRQELYSRARSYMHAHPDVRVPELARHCGMSESGLYAFFKSYAGTTPITEKNHILIKRAVTLLGSTDLPIEEISERVGFQSVAYFRKLFKEECGKTPTEIRREQRKQFGL